MVKEATGRELKLDGDINLAFGFSPALVVTDITFANASWGSQPQMAKIDEFQAQVRLLPLLARDVKLRGFGLTGVDVWLETNPDGQGNWEFSVAESPPKRAGGFKATQITADIIRIKDLDLTFRDGKSGATTQFDLTDLKLTRTADDDRLAVDLRAEYGGQPITLSGEIGLINKGRSGILNIEIRDPGGNMVEGYRSEVRRSDQPLTRMAVGAIQLKGGQQNQTEPVEHSTVEADMTGYRDYRGVPVFGVWQWDFELFFFRFGTARIRDGCIQADTGVSGRLGEPATRARDRLFAGRD